MGRNTLLTEDTKNIILDYISKGNYIKTACLAAGVSEATFYSWVQRAENPANGNKIYLEFLEELKKARQKNISQRVAKIQDAGEKPQNWMANAWLLERMIPGEYGRRIELEVGPSKVLMALQEQAQKALTQDTQREITTQPVIEGEEV